MSTYLLALLLQASDGVLEVTYPPSTQPGELQFGVTYRIWIPAKPPKIRGVIVHQHGYGASLKSEPSRPAE